MGMSVTYPRLHKILTQSCSYFDEILQQTPEAVEDVMVEADGQWHTTDNKYASAQWKAAHPSKPLSPRKVEPSQSPSRAPPPPIVNGTAPQANGKGKALDIEILVLDSDDDEDEGRVKRELSPSYASSARASFDSLPQIETQTSSVIDLTLDDSDDEQPPPAASTFGKRKASDANLDTTALPDQPWKRGRIDASRILPAPTPSGTPGALALHTSISSLPSSPSGGRFSSSFQGNMLPPVYPAFNNGRPGSGNTNPSLQLPPLSRSVYGAGSSRQPSSHHPGWS